MPCFGFNADNKVMVYLLQGSAHTETRVFQLLLTTLSVRRLGVHQELGGDRARTAGPEWPQGYFILCGFM